MTEPLGKVDQEEIKLRLTRGQDFQQIITPPEYETFPPGTTARIDFYSNPTSGSVIASWPAHSCSVSHGSAVRQQTLRGQGRLSSLRSRHHRVGVAPC